MPRAVEVVFTGAVFNVHVELDGHEVSLRRGFEDSDEWKGAEALELEGERADLELRFTAPSFTDWELAVEIDGEEAFEDSGTSETARFRLETTIPLP